MKCTLFWLTAFHINLGHLDLVHLHSMFKYFPVNARSRYRLKGFRIRLARLKTVGDLCASSVAPTTHLPLFAYDTVISLILFAFL